MLKTGTMWSSRADNKVVGQGYHGYILWGFLVQLRCSTMDSIALKLRSGDTPFMAVAILQCYSITCDVLVVYIVYTVLLIYNMVTFALQAEKGHNWGQV